MEKIIKAFASLMGIAVLNLVAFVLYLSVSKLPGGEVGMVPFLVALQSVIAGGISFIIYVLVRQRIINVTIVRLALIYQVVYLLVLLFSGVNPFNENLRDSLRDLSLWIYLISFMITIGIVVFFKLADRSKK